MDVLALLAQYKEEPESEAQLKSLLPLIVSCFGANKSVPEIMEELKKHQQSADPEGIFFFFRFQMNGIVIMSTNLLSIT